MTKLWRYLWPDSWRWWGQHSWPNCWCWWGPINDDSDVYGCVWLCVWPHVWSYTYTIITHLAIYEHRDSSGATIRHDYRHTYYESGPRKNNTYRYDALLIVYIVVHPFYMFLSRPRYPIWGFIVWPNKVWCIKWYLPFLTLGIHNVSRMPNNDLT